MQMLATAIEQARAEHKIFHRPRIRPSGPGQTGGHCAADGCAVSEMRRLKRQHLPACGQRRLDFCQWCARARGEHQFGGVVGHNAAVCARVQHIGIFRLRLFAVKIFCAAALDDQRNMAVGGMQNLLAYSDKGLFHNYFSFRRP